MKKIITLLAVLMVGTSLFSQYRCGTTQGSFARQSPIQQLENKPVLINSNYIANATLSFTEGDKTYLLSYPLTISKKVTQYGYTTEKREYARNLCGSNDINERNIYVYEVKKNGFEIVSDIVLTDFDKVSDNVQSYASSCLHKHDVYDGRTATVTKRDDGSVSIGFSRYIGTEGDMGDFRNVWVNVNLYPNGDGTYSSSTVIMKEIKND